MTGNIYKLYVNTVSLSVMFWGLEFTMCNNGTYERALNLLKSVYL